MLFCCFFSDDSSNDIPDTDIHLGDPIKNFKVRFQEKTI